MVRMLCIASLALAVVSAVSGHVLRHRAPPQGWAAAYLEPYDVYHTRYLDFGCKEKHNTMYFSNCCHPLLKDESVSVLHDRKCFSTADSTSDNVDCDDGSSPVPAFQQALSPTPVISPSLEKSTPISSPPVYTKAPTPQTPARPAAVEHAPVSTPLVTLAAVEHAPVSTPLVTPAAVEHAPVSTPLVTTKAATSTPAPANNGNNDGSWQWGGRGTYYWQNGNAGACGQHHADTDMIVAIDAAWYGDTTKVSSFCGKQVEIINTDNQNSVTLTIADACPTCDNANSLDLSHTAFESLSDPSTGNIPIKWRFV